MGLATPSGVLRIIEILFWMVNQVQTPMKTTTSSEFGCNVRDLNCLKPATVCIHSCKNQFVIKPLTLSQVLQFLLIQIHNTLPNEGNGARNQVQLNIQKIPKKDRWVEVHDYKATSCGEVEENIMQIIRSISDLHCIYVRKVASLVCNYRVKG